MASNEQTTIFVDPEPWRVTDGPLLLLAGPGTGKTHQLALRIKDLVTTRTVSPESVTVITFTKAAASNMRDRISDEGKADVYLPPNLRPRKIMTMHSLGLEIVRKNAGALALPPDFTILSDPRVRKILFQDAAVLANEEPAAAEEAAQTRQEGRVFVPGSPAAKVLGRYEEILRACKAVDYDDLIFLACTVLEQDPAVLRDYANESTHLLVDEYQDINQSQRAFIELLVRQNRAGLFAVGDDDQSIYSFRGGTPEYIRSFRTEFGDGARILSLDESRRCPSTVMNSALAVVQQFNSARLAKPTPTFKGARSAGNKIQIHSVATDDHEAMIIATIAADPITTQKRLLKTSA